MIRLNHGPHPDVIDSVCDYRPRTHVVAIKMGDHGEIEMSYSQETHTRPQFLGVLPRVNQQRPSLALDEESITLANITLSDNPVSRD
ncbi:MAG: hypothetical protein EBT14_08170 [Betaproteobacteria bacterium]|nr:hypothetical protein [Betaproteobacteria bacterium]